MSKSVDLPELPPFIAERLPYPRGAYRLQNGPDAGKRLHYLDTGGDGPVVFMVHGNPTWSFLWRKVIAELDGFRCIAPDMLGLGFSDLLPKIEDHAVDRHSDALAELVDHLDLQDAVLVGQDWGGPMSVCTAARRPDRFRALVLGNTAIILPKRPRGTSFHRFARRPILSDLVFRGFGFPQNILHRTQGDPSTIRGDVARAYRYPFRGWSRRVAPLALARMVPDSVDHPSYAAIARGSDWALNFGGPVHLVWGEKDPILGRALKRHVEAFPDAEVVRTQAGHFLQEEVPGALAEAIRACAA